MQHGKAGRHLGTTDGEPRDYWTKERVVAAVRRWADMYGSPPSTRDWNSVTIWAREDSERERRLASGRWPGPNTVVAKFGSWNAAIEAAGLEPKSATRRNSWAKEPVVEPKPVVERGYWTKERIVEAIQRWVDLYGAPPRTRDWDAAAIRAKGDSERERRLANGKWPGASTVESKFGSWNAAIEAAGYEPKAAVNQRYWTKERIVEAIQRWVDMYGAPPTSMDWNASAIRAQGDPEREQRLASGRWPGPDTVESRFGGWNAAIEAAGYESRSAARRGYWTKERIIEAIQRWVDRYGAPPTSMDWNAAAIRAQGDSERERRLASSRWPGASTVHSQFGSWNAAIEAAGYEPKAAVNRRYWTKERIVEAIQRWVERYGAPPTNMDWHTGAIRAQGDPERKRRLASGRWPGPGTVESRFGGWNAAIEAAGYESRPAARRGYWTKERIVEAIQRWVDRYGAPPRASDWNTAAMRAQGDSDSEQEERLTSGRWPSTSTAMAKFGSWTAAIEAAGYRPKSAARRGYWTKERIVEAIQQWVERHGAPPTSVDWNAAAIRAQGDPEREQRLENGRWPGPGRVQSQFGSWNAAIKAAGYWPRSTARRSYWTKERIVEAIQQWVERYGAPPRVSDWNAAAIRAQGDRGRERRLASGEWPGPGTVYSKFGGWNAAIAAAGHEPRFLAKGSYWTKKRIVEAIQQWVERYGAPPTSVDWNAAVIRAQGDAEREQRLESGRWPGASTVISRFGSWNAAIKAAGYEPRFAGGDRRAKRGYWTKERIVEAVKRWADRYGSPPTSMDWNAAAIRARGDSERKQRLANGRWPGASTVHSKFGGWNAAIKAAGYEPRESVGGRLRDSDRREAAA